MPATAFAINGGAWNSQAWNGPGVSLNPAQSHAILFIATSITLNWTQVVGAVSWDIQVSLFADFRTTTILNTNVANSTHTFTDAGDNNKKRYWRVRPKNALGDYIEPWSEIASYWLDTTAAQEISLNRNEWGLGDISDTTDVYTLELFPPYTVVPQNFYRINTRNRLGELLNEFLTVKDLVTLNFVQNSFLEHTQMDEFQRFNNQLRNFYLVAFKDGLKERPFPHIWKVQFQEDPNLTMIAAGRPDLLTGTLNFEEV